MAPGIADHGDLRIRGHETLTSQAIEKVNMPNTTSAKKRLRQNVVRRSRNRSVMSALRKRIRSVRDAVAAKDFAKADELFRVAAKYLDRAGTERIIHPNRASRSKSRLQHLIVKAKSAH